MVFDRDRPGSGASLLQERKERKDEKETKKKKKKGEIQTLLRIEQRKQNVNVNDLLL